MRKIRESVTIWQKSNAWLTVFSLGDWRYSSKDPYFSLVISGITFSKNSLAWRIFMEKSGEERGKSEAGNFREISNQTGFDQNPSKIYIIGRCEWTFNFQGKFQVENNLRSRFATPQTGLIKVLANGTKRPKTKAFRGPLALFWRPYSLRLGQISWALLCAYAPAKCLPGLLPALIVCVLDALWKENRVHLVDRGSHYCYLTAWRCLNFSYFETTIIFCCLFY